MRLLVVEDESAAAEFLAKGLREHAYAVDIAQDGASALERIVGNDHDLILLDVLLPRLSGLAVCRQLREDGSPIPILMLTARGGPDQRGEGRVQAARVLADPKQVAIDVDAPRPAPFVGDEDLVRRLIVNLLDNAIRHAPSSSSVAVKLRPTARDYAIAVSDCGPGVPVEAQPHLFERFFRADPARTRARPSDDGAGLSLALARWIANVHGGDVHLTESGDAGTTFTAVLSHREGTVVTSRTAALP